jgi:hypothetical protein
MMKTGLLETHYFASIPYFHLLKSLDEIILEKHEHYIKQSFRNRCVINTSNGPHRLIIPIVSTHQKVLITEAKIDHSYRWVDNHWRTIRSAYGKAPFFEYYADEFYPVLAKKHEFLYALNRELLGVCLKILGMKKVVKESEMYEKSPVQTIIDYRNAINAKNNTQRKVYTNPIEYHQVFGVTFIPDLSILDLIFCAGPEAPRFL